MAAPIFILYHFFMGSMLVSCFALVTNVRNKLECLSLASPFQPSLMYMGKAGAYLNGAPEINSTLEEAPGFGHKHYTRL